MPLIRARPQGDAPESSQKQRDVGESQILLQALFDNALEAILLADEQGCYVDANPAACALTGYSREELLRMAVWDITPESNRESGPETWQHFLSASELSGEYTILCKDGTERETEFRAVANIVPGIHFSALRDITERERAEELRQESAKRLSTVISNAPLILWAMDHQGVITHSEGRGLEVLGFRPGQLVGQSVFDLYHNTPEVLELARRALAGEEFSSHTKLGKVVLEVRWVPQREDQGSLTSVIAVAVDITERANAEASLRESEERFAKAFHASPIPIAITTIAEGRFVDVNDSLLRLYGYRREEIIDHTTVELKMTENAGDRDALLHRLREQGMLQNVEHTFQTKSGDLRWGISSFELITLNGEPCILALTLDTTERNRSEEALRQERDFISAVLDTVGSLVVVLDRQALIVHFNRACEHLTGYSFDEVKGRNIMDVILAPEESEAVKDVLQDIYSGQFPSTHENYWIPRDGNRRLITWANTALLDAAGDVEYIICTGMDITERRRSEEELAASREQLRGLAARQDAVLEAERTHIAREIHDQMGQVLSGLKMDLSWLSEQLLVVSEDELRHKIAVMSKLIDTTIHSVREIATKLRPAMLDDLGLEPAIEWETQRFEERTGISCAFTSQAGDVALSREQATAAFRILQEALTNVVRHAGATHVDVRLQQRDNDLVLEITDDGRGITQDQIAKAGSLGLLGMRERAHLLGGYIRFAERSTHGRGTTITLCLPLLN